jgi:hypothetical protein
MRTSASLVLPPYQLLGTLCSTLCSLEVESAYALEYPLFERDLGELCV